MRCSTRAVLRVHRQTLERGAQPSMHIARCRAPGRELARQLFCTEVLPVAGRGAVWQYTAILVRLPASEPWRLWEPVTLPGRRGCVSPKLAAPSRVRAVIGQAMFLERKRRCP